MRSHTRGRRLRQQHGVGRTNIEAREIISIACKCRTHTNRLVEDLEKLAVCFAQPAVVINPFISHLTTNSSTIWTRHGKVDHGERCLFLFFAASKARNCARLLLANVQANIGTVKQTLDALGHRRVLVVGEHRDAGLDPGLGDPFAPGVVEIDRL